MSDFFRQKSSSLAAQVFAAGLARGQLKLMQASHLACPGLVHRHGQSGACTLPTT